MQNSTVAARKSIQILTEIALLIENYRQFYILVWSFLVLIVLRFRCEVKRKIADGLLNWRSHILVTAD